MKKKLVSMLVVFMVLSFAFNSVAAFNPPGQEKKGTIPYGIMKKFLSIEANKTYQTEIKEIDLNAKRITIEDGTAILKLLVSNDAKIELKNKKVALKDLKVNDKVYIKLNSKNTITEIKVLEESRKVVEEISGLLKAIDKGAKKIYLQVNNTTTLKEVKLESNTVIKINGVVKTIDNLNVDMQTKVTIEDGKAKLVEVTDNQNIKVTGTIFGLDSSEKTIIIETGSKYQLYYVKSGSKVYVDNQLKSFSNLAIGMTVELYVDSLDVKNLYATSTAIAELKAVIKTINTSAKEIVLTYNNREELYGLATNAVIKVDGLTKTINDLKVDMNVDVKIKNGQIIEIVGNNLVATIEGQLVAKDMNNFTIALKVNTEIKNYNVSREYTLTHVEVGKQVIIYVKDGVVIAIANK